VRISELKRTVKQNLVVRNLLFYTLIHSLSLSHISILELRAKYPETETPGSVPFWVNWDYPSKYY